MSARQHCQNCGRKRKLYALALRLHRPAYYVCADCIEKIAGGVAMVERATRRRAA